MAFVAGMGGMIHHATKGKSNNAGKSMKNLNNFKRHSQEDSSMEFRGLSDNSIESNQLMNHQQTNLSRREGSHRSFLQKIDEDQDDNNDLPALKKRSNIEKSKSKESVSDVDDRSHDNIVKSLVKERTKKVESNEEDEFKPRTQKSFKPSVQFNEKTNKIEIKLQQNKHIYSENSLFILKKSNKIRRFVIQLTEWKYFEFFIMITILLNSFCLAIFDYQDRDSNTYYNQVLDNIMQAFIYIFVVECVLKIIAQGFILHKHSYMRDGWNFIDFVVVVLSMLEYISNTETSNFKSLRVLRVLRPLRSFNAIPSIRKLVHAFIQALPEFLHVAIFLIFVFVLFAILGLHQFNGMMYNRCRINPKPETPTSWANYKDINRVCSQTEMGNYVCPNGMVCGNPVDYDIPLENEDIYNNGQFNYGISNFDNLGSALLTVFHIITMQGWTKVMLNLMDADISFIGSFYCISIVIIGSFFLMNLILAVIIQAFIKVQKQELEHEIMKLDFGKDQDTGKKVTVQDLEKEKEALVDAKSMRRESRGSGMYLNIPNDNDAQNLNMLNAGQTPLQLEEKTADFSFLKKVKVQTKVLNLLTGGKLKQSFKKSMSNAIDTARESQRSNADDHLDFMKEAGLIHQEEFKDISKALPEKGLWNDAQTRDKDHEDKNEAKMEEEFKDQFPQIPQTDQAMSLIDLDINYQSASSPQKKPALQIKEAVWKYIQVDDLDKSIKTEQKIPKKSILKKPSDISGFSYQSATSDTALKNQNYRSSAPTANKVIIQESQAKEEQPTQQIRMQNAFRKFIEKKKDEQYQKEQYFNKVLAETKQDYLQKKKTMNQQMNLRQLAHQKLGIKIKRQKNNLVKEVERFKIEDRAESNKLYFFCFKLVRSPHFTRTINLIIIINTVVLSLDKYPIEDEERYIQNQINTGFSIIFILEMVAKLLAFGFRTYLRDPFNVFDGIIVLTSFVDMVMEFTGLQETSGAITAFRAFRLIRIFKLAKSWRKLHNLLKTMGRTLKDISTFSILLFIFIFIYTLLALQVFAYKGRFMSDGTVNIDKGTAPTVNFDGFIYSFTTVFIILTNDGWSDIFFNYHRAAGGPIAIFYFVTLILLGQKILLNLFLAILLENFDEASLNEEIKDKIKKKKGNGKVESLLQRLWQRVKSCCTCSKVKKWLQGQEHDDYGGILDESSVSASKDLSRDLSSASFASRQDEGRGLDNGQSLRSSFDQSHVNLSATTILKRREKKLQDTDEVPSIYGVSLFIFTQTNCFRKLCFNVVTNPKFDYIIILVIFLSGVQLALDSPLNDPNSNFVATLYWIDLSTTVVFCLEALIKLIAFGFLFNGKWSYMRNTWNVLDFIIIVFSVISLTPLPSQLRIVKIFRVIRGLRLVGKNEGLQLAVKALLQAIPQIANVTIITLLFFLIFGIIGVSYFKGKFQFCKAASHSSFNDILVTNRWECYNAGGHWINKAFSFDSVTDSMQTLFVMATTSGWSEHMFTSVNSTDPDDVSLKDNNIFWIFFFIFFIIVGSFFLLNLFVGVVISTFNREKDKIGGNNLLTDRQKNWIDTKLIALKAKPKMLIKMPQSCLRRLCFKLYEKSWFETVIYICIILNTIILALKFYRQPGMMNYALEILNYIFAGIFLLEAIIKILAMGTHFFKDNWNLFDFLVVLASMASIIVAFFSDFNLGGAATIIRAFRITRVMRLVKRAKNLRLVFHTFICTLPALANVGGLLLLLLYLYSIIGMNLFGLVKRNNALNANLNFETFGSSFISLFIIATGDAWDSIMISTLPKKSIVFDCVNDPTYEIFVANGYNTVGCGADTFTGLIFFYSYFLFVNLIFLNLFIAIILQGFDDTQSKDSRLFNQETLDKFRDVWAKYDPDATTFIKIANIKSLLFDLAHPLGWDNSYKDNISMQDKFIASLDLPIYNNFSDYMFMDVLEALALRLVVQEQLDLEKKKIQKDHEQKDSLLDESSDEEQHDTLKKEKEIKDQIEKDINKLTYQADAQKIQAVKEVLKGQIKAKMTQKQIAQDNHFTSLHQAAAQVAVSHMKFIVAKRKLMKQLEVATNPISNMTLNTPFSPAIIPSKRRPSTLQIMMNRIQEEEHSDESPNKNEESSESSSDNDKGKYRPNCVGIEVAQFYNEPLQLNVQNRENQDQFVEETNGEVEIQNASSKKEKVIIQKIYQNININTHIVTSSPNQNFEEEKTNTVSQLRLCNLNKHSDMDVLDTVRMNQIIDQEMNALENRIMQQNGNTHRTVFKSSSKSLIAIAEELLQMERNGSNSSTNHKSNKKRQRGKQPSTFKQEAERSSGNSELDNSAKNSQMNRQSRQPNQRRNDNSNTVQQLSQATNQNARQTNQQDQLDPNLYSQSLDLRTQSKIVGSVGGTGDCADLDESLEENKVKLEVQAALDLIRSTLRQDDQLHHTQQDEIHNQDEKEGSFHKLATAMDMKSFSRSKTVSRKDFDVQSIEISQGDLYPVLPQSPLKKPKVSNNNLFMIVDTEQIHSYNQTPHNDSIYGKQRLSQNAALEEESPASVIQTSN